MAKITIVIGENIEIGAMYFSSLSLPMVKTPNIYTFPEVNPGPGKGFPLHASKIREEVLGITDMAKIVDVIIITHSSIPVNMIGEMIEKGDFTKDDVEVWMYDGEDFTTKRNGPDHLYRFSEQGYLIDWPFGWFDF